MPDTSVVLNNGLFALLESGKLGERPTVCLSRVVVQEVERLADRRREAGILGLESLVKLRKLEREGSLSVEVVGERPNRDAVELNRMNAGELDAAIVKDALQAGATLVTSDRVQARVARVEGLRVLFHEPPHDASAVGESLRIESFFDEETLSVHLKEDAVPYAKKGRPGDWRLVNLGNVPLSVKQLRELGSELLGRAKDDPKSFVEISSEGVTVVQLRDFRVVITRPPFASGFEITAVRPLVSLRIEDYDLSPRLLKRVDKAEGLLVCGSPGAGKSTFVAALAEYYLRKNKIVKTLESVRDLQVPPQVTQYQLTDEHAVDVLLLVRPDFTLYDEVRTRHDFRQYADLRLAGVGMVGVVHSSSAIDAVQRFVPHLDLGMIPSIIDTIIFIEDGRVETVLELKLVVKVPAGFRDRDLARPVIEVKNTETGQLEFELYTFGDHVVVSPVRKVYKKGGTRSVSTAGWNGESPSERKITRVDVRVTKKSIVLNAPPWLAGRTVVVGVDQEALFEGTVSGKGQLRVAKNSPAGRVLWRALKRGRSPWVE